MNDNVDNLRTSLKETQHLTQFVHALYDEIPIDP